MNNIGTLIRDARTAAGLTPEDLAEQVGSLTAEEITLAENGEKKLIRDQIRAIAKATGVTQKSLLDAAKNTPAADEAVPSEKDEAAKPEAEPVTEESILELFRNADAEMQKLAVSVLKGEVPQKTDLLTTVAGMMGSTPNDLMKNIMSYLNSEEGKATIGKVMKSLGGFMQSLGEKREEPPYGVTISGSLLTFTYCYSVTIYLLLLSFYFWLWRKDIKPEKQA